MKLGKYFSRDRFSLRQVVGMLTVVIAGISVLAYAAVTIPYTFTSGTTAKSSEVNANFQAVANAIPAVKTAYLQNMTNITAISTSGCSLSGTPLHSLQVTLPAPGQVILNATGLVCNLWHQLGYKESITLKISKTSGDADCSTGTRFVTTYNVPSTEPSYTTGASDWICEPFSINDVADETSGGTMTYYLNGARIQGTPTASDAVMAVALTAQYVPNALP